MSSIRDLVEDFVDKLSAAVETQAIARARVSVEAALAGQPFARGNGRLRAAAIAITSGGLGVRKPRKKPPIQLCPVPGCTERAAPIFGMVCAKHKDVSKTKIRQYREARRAGKVAAKSTRSAGGRGRKAAPPARAKAKARAKSRKPPTSMKAAAPAKVEVAQKAAPVRASGTAASRIKPKRPAILREAMPVPAAMPAPAPAQA